MSEIPRGWDICAWVEAEAVLSASGGVFGIELLKHGGSIDSFRVNFEPGESEIGIHQAEHCLGLRPVKKNILWGLDENEEPPEQDVKVDFAYIRDRTAADLRRVSSLITERATEVGQGDLAAFEHLMEEEWRAWWDMLNIRYYYLQENRGKTIKD